MSGTHSQGFSPNNPFKAEWEISPHEVHRRRTQGECIVLIDCRTDAERELASIEGSIHAPMQSLSRHIDELREHEESPVVVYCHQGGRSMQVTAALRHAGFEDVRSLAGGIHQWALEIDPRVPTY